jgi:hypothetical protein
MPVDFMLSSIFDVREQTVPAISADKNISTFDMLQLLSFAGLGLSSAVLVILSVRFPNSCQTCVAGSPSRRK